MEKRSGKAERFADRTGKMIQLIVQALPDDRLLPCPDRPEGNSCREAGRSNAIDHRDRKLDFPVAMGILREVGRQPGDDYGRMGDRSWQQQHPRRVLGSGDGSPRSPRAS